MVLTVCTGYSIITPDIVLLFPVWSVSTLSRRATDHESGVSVYILYQTAIPGLGRLITITNHKSSSIFLTSPVLETFCHQFISVCNKWNCKWLDNMGLRCISQNVSHLNLLTGVRYLRGGCKLYGYSVLNHSLLLPSIPSGVKFNIDIRRMLNNEQKMYSMKQWALYSNIICRPTF